MPKTRIVVIRMKEIIYSALFLGIGLLIILILVLTLKPKSTAPTENAAKKYTAGTYTAQLSLNNTALNVAVIINENEISSIKLENIDESMETMFPLLKPSIESLGSQIIENQSTASVELSDESRFTETLLLDAINSIISQARITP